MELLSLSQSLTVMKIGTFNRIGLFDLAEIKLKVKVKRNRI